MMCQLFCIVIPLNVTIQYIVIRDWDDEIFLKYLLFLIKIFLNLIII